MSVLDFLFPTLMAAESHIKNKERKIVREQYVIAQQTDKQIREEEAFLTTEYTDINAELDAKWSIGNNDSDDGRNGYFIWEDLIKSLPSYDPNNEDDDYVLGVSPNSAIKSREWCKTLAMARQFGKLRKKDVLFSNSLYVIELPNEMNWWGRDRFFYKGQIFHEMLTQWHLYMKEHGFPYNLMVCNPLDYPAGIRSYKDSVVITEEPLFRGGHKYYWDFDFNKTKTFSNLSR